jgi:hypothetical protein
MKFFNSNENRIITCEEMCAKYATHEAIPALGIFELSAQPDYEPVSFELEQDGTYYPVQSYEDKVAQARAALIAAGLSESEADAALA